MIFVYSTSKAYIDVNVGRSNLILLISTIIGWTYFVAWSISFYPQLWDNFKRKSVIGLNFDFVALNLTGFISYSIFNIALFAFEVVQKEYEIRHPRSQIPVQINDVVFAVHAALATFACIIQCLIYEVRIFNEIYYSISELSNLIFVIFREAIKKSQYLGRFFWLWSGLDILF